MSDYTQLTASEAAAAIAAKTLTSTALTEACLARIERREAAVCAWAHLDPEFALAQARAADELQASGAPLGPLHGVPVGIKDIIDVAGLRGENGSAAFAGRRPSADAVVVSNLRLAGAVVLGKTVTTELANRAPNKTRHPRNGAHTPGGSSSGSAAGVADCMMPLALATQTAGSIIRPASYCGVFGLKPTFGLVPRRGALLQSHTLDTIGVYGRSVSDLALGLGAMAVHDPADPSSVPHDHRAYVSMLKADGDRVRRLAFVRSPAWSAGTDAMRTALESFAKSLGAACVEVDLPPTFDSALHWHATIMATEAAHYYGPLLDGHPDKLSDVLKERLTAGRTIPAHRYVAAVVQREPLYAELLQALQSYDAILTPAATGTAPKGLADTGDPIFNSLWTYLGVPCVTLPLLELDGMPLGVQLVGCRGEDGPLLATAQWLTQHS